MLIAPIARQRRKKGHCRRPLSLTAAALAGGVLRTAAHNSCKARAAVGLPAGRERGLSQLPQPQAACGPRSLSSRRRGSRRPRHSRSVPLRVPVPVPGSAPLVSVPVPGSAPLRRLAAAEPEPDPLLPSRPSLASKTKLVHRRPSKHPCISKLGLPHKCALIRNSTYYAFDSKRMPPVGGAPSRHTGTGGAPNVTSNEAGAASPAFLAGTSHRNFVEGWLAKPHAAAFFGGRGRGGRSDYFFAQVKSGNSSPQVNIPSI
jgi:hypothetical protein